MKIRDLHPKIKYKPDGLIYTNFVSPILNHFKNKKYNYDEKSIEDWIKINNAIELEMGIHQHSDGNWYFTPDIIGDYSLPVHKYKFYCKMTPNFIDVINEYFKGVIPDVKMFRDPQDDRFIDFESLYCKDDKNIQMVMKMNILTNLTNDEYHYVELKFDTRKKE